MQQHEKPWNPLTIDAVADLFAGASFPWWIAGGIALELAVGQVIRKHADIDVLILRPDHVAARALLSPWDCWAADPPGTLRRWPVGERLCHAVHDVWCRKAPTDDWRVQLMIDEADATDWVSRRDKTVRAPIRDITRTARSGVRYLAPHVQLYYKAKSLRAKDEVDFEAVMRSGVRMDTGWLRGAISRTYGSRHPWLARLRE